MNVPLINKEKWTIQDIDYRTKELIEDIIRLYPYYASTLPNVNNNESIPIYPSSKDIYGQAYYSIDGSVTIMQGTTLRRSDVASDTYPAVAKNISELLSKNIVGYKDGVFQFLKDYTFYPQGSKTALSTTASLLSGGSRNGYEWWLLNNGFPISQIMDGAILNND